MEERKSLQTARRLADAIESRGQADRRITASSAAFLRQATEACLDPAFDTLNDLYRDLSAFSDAVAMAAAADRQIIALQHQLTAEMRADADAYAGPVTPEQIAAVDDAILDQALRMLPNRLRAAAVRLCMSDVVVRAEAEAARARTLGAIRDAASEAKHASE